MLGDHKEVCGPAIGVDISEYIPLKGKPINKMNSVGSGSLYGTTLNGMLAAIGMPSLERIVDNTLGNPNNYSTYINGVTFKGKNRTFKNKVSRKRVLHKDRRLDEFKIAMNSMRRWID